MFGAKLDRVIFMYDTWTAGVVPNLLKFVVVEEATAAANSILVEMEALLSPNCHLLLQNNISKHSQKRKVQFLQLISKKRLVLFNNIEMI